MAPASFSATAALSLSLYWGIGDKRDSETIPFVDAAAAAAAARIKVPVHADGVGAVVRAVHCVHAVGTPRSGWIPEAVGPADTSSRHQHGVPAALRLLRGEET